MSFSTLMGNEVDVAGDRQLLGGLGPGIQEGPVAGAGEPEG